MEAKGRARLVTRLEAHDLWVRPPGAAAGRTDPGSGDGFTVRGFGLRLEAGEWIGVTGPNGGGKTSLLLALAGLWPAARGEVRVGGDPLGPGARRDVRGRVAVVLQDPSSQILQPTVGDEIAFACRNLGLPADQVESRTRRALDAFQLGDVAARDPSRLPAGRQQLVLLAGALAQGPEVLVADEPGAHWDPPHRALALDLVEAECRRGLAVLWASQHAEELGRAARVIQVGEQAETFGPGTPPDLSHSPPPRGGGGARPVLELSIGPWHGGGGAHVEADSAIELAVPTGGVTSVTGRNGAGKSVLLAAAAGVSPIDQVRARWTTAPEHPPLLVTQYPELLFFEEIARDEVCYAARSRGLPAEETVRRAEGCFAALELPGASILSRRMWELSGGTRRLVEVVAALIAPAGLVALDEPTAGLDPVRRAGLARLVRDRSRTCAVLVASQDLEWLGALGARRHELGSWTRDRAAKS